MKTSNQFLMSLLLLMLPLLSATRALAAQLNAEQIMARSATAYDSKDLFSRISFTFSQSGTAEKKITVYMAFKDYHGKRGINAKIIMFNQFPPDKKDISFLAWLYAPETHRKDDMWLYLPALRSIRKMSHQDHKMQHDDKNKDDFSLSDLKRFELQKRSPQLDRHQLAGREQLGAHETYKIISIPKNPGSSPYGKTVHWITTDNFLPIQREYFDRQGRLAKRQTIQWTTQNHTWVWKKVTAINLETGHQTVLQQTDVKVNSGLADRIFSKRFMKRGAGTLVAQIR